MTEDRTKGNLDLVLLAVLAGQPGHGYAIITALKQRTGGVLDLPEGSVYPALHRLEDRGLVSSEWKAAGGRRRREYRLSADGLTALVAEQRDWDRLTGAIGSLLVSIRPARAGGLA